MGKAVVYVHGKGGQASEARAYAPLFPSYEMIGFEYRAATPWEAKKEFTAFFERCRRTYDELVLIANSIGAYFSMQTTVTPFRKAYFISPVVDMERLILDMMAWAKVTEDALERVGRVSTSFGEDLSWDYLTYVREHPARWHVPTEIAYGSKDGLVRRESVEAFSEKIGAKLSVLSGGEHWFHTEEQMAFLRAWIAAGERE